jgi:hypothetical protein
VIQKNDKNSLCGSKAGKLSLTPEEKGGKFFVDK